MSTRQTRQFTIGSAVRCGDGVRGQLRQLVIEPIDRVLTHLVVKPEQRGQEPRLVPLGLVASSADPAAPEQIALHCSLAEFETFERALPRHFLAGASGRWDYRQEQMPSWPHCRLGLSGGPADGAGAFDRVPLDGDRAAAALGDASDTMMAHPLALQLRNLQSLVEIGVDKNTTVVFPAPLMTTIAELGAFLAREKSAAGPAASPPVAAARALLDAALNGAPGPGE